eukprot:CAMPEP_0172311328 /NCGR_PEP_ID=MMETSP1058-20130122/14610_1 /TAXON_ID=83371 /ORGANISM="Detonula confervacea, Strain CCMP 353" /LENGTH=226 /DNA_ID=CAMNT_0013024483 /DNA_START=291 /DNA_END=967 /DNA_ORIENTATION=+
MTTVNGNFIRLPKVLSLLAIMTSGQMTAIEGAPSYLDASWLEGSYIDFYHSLGDDGQCKDHQGRSYDRVMKSVPADNDDYTGCSSQCAEKVCAEICHTMGLTDNYLGFEVRTRGSPTYSDGYARCHCLYENDLLPSTTGWSIPTGVDATGLDDFVTHATNAGSGPIADKAAPQIDDVYKCYAVTPLDSLGSGFERNSRRLLTTSGPSKSPSSSPSKSPSSSPSKSP